MNARAYTLGCLSLVAGIAIGTQHVACSSNTCCGGQGDSNNQIPGAPDPPVRVLDAVSGAPLCNAMGIVEPTGGDVLGACTVTFADNAPNFCDQPQAGTYAATVTIDAPGYRTGQVTFPIWIGACGQWAWGDGGVQATVRLVPECATPLAHQNGTGQSWTDCTPAGTIDRAQATSACEYDPKGNQYSCGDLVTCDPDAGASSDLAVCTATKSGGGPYEACDCWTFQGVAAGRVHSSTSGCVCATVSDPSWE